MSEGRGRFWGVEVFEDFENTPLNGWREYGIIYGVLCEEGFALWNAGWLGSKELSL